jgi:nucleoside-diphosphate-sugar epimerase
MTESAGQTVLVTGGTGFLGGWCVIELLRRGYRVRATVRAVSREPELRSIVRGQGLDDGNLEVVVADLGNDAGWPQAVDGCTYVLHVASPFPTAQPDDPDELIVPARDGTLRVLRAALDAGVERVVVTSSVAAIRNTRSEPGPGPRTEEHWTDAENTALSPYTRSKTIAERAAWDLVRERGEESRLAVVNPGAIIGPTLTSDHSASLALVSRLLGGLPAAPRLGWTLVDVRDVADLEIAAMTTPAAGGERFIAADRFMWMTDVSRVLRDRLGDAGRKAPTRTMPDVLVRLIARFDASVRTTLPDLGKRVEYSSEKARTQLGWQPRPVEDSIEDCARSLVA